MSADLLLAIDVGTQSVRALVFTASGTLLDKAQVFIEPYFSRQAGWAEQDADLYWRSICEACQMLWQRGFVKPQAIAGLSVTTQRGTVVNVDKQGKPLRPAITWLDQRRTTGLTPVGGLWGLAFRAINMRKTIAYFQAEAEINWLAKHEANVWQNTHKFLLLSGYISYKLCAEFVDSVGSQVAYIPFDYKALSWAKAWDWKWQVLKHIEPRHLPKLVNPAEQLGELCTEAAKEMGLRAGLKVIAAASDKACEVIGAGALAANIACISYGTTATLNITQKRYLEAIPFLPPYPSAVPNHYSLETQVFRGYWMVNWFKQEFGHLEQERAKDLLVSTEALFDELITTVPAGSMGLIVQPYWSPGLKNPGPEAKGAMIGFGDVHTRAHMYRAMLEGIAYALLEGAERMQKRSKVTVTELRVAGGGSQSNGAMQLTADVFGLSASRPSLYEASGLGAAIDCSVGLGFYDSFEAAIKNMTRVGDVFEPNQQNHLLYKELYEQVYKPLYKKVQPLYEAIKDITGYPA